MIPISNEKSCCQSNRMFHKEYLKTKDEEGFVAEFDIHEIHDDIISQGMYDAAKQSEQTRSSNSKEAAKDEDSAEEEAANNFIGLITLGQGVQAPVIGLTSDI